MFYWLTYFSMIPLIYSTILKYSGYHTVNQWNKAFTNDQVLNESIDRSYRYIDTRKGDDFVILPLQKEMSEHYSTVDYHCLTSGFDWYCTL